MAEMYTSGMEDIPTPEENELKEGNYWERARLELMRSPETRAFDEEIKNLEMAASQAEEVSVSADTLKKLLEASRDLERAEQLMAEAKRKQKETRKQAIERVTELEQQLASSREEAKKKPALKIRILQNFKEGIQYFKKGDVMETHNIDWALVKIDQKLAERVGFEVPVKIVPEVPLRVEVPKVREDRVRVLTDRFISVLSRNQVPIRPEYRARLRDELPAILQALTLEEQLRLTEQLAMEIVNEYKAKVEVARRIREVVPGAPPTVKEIPPEWKRTEAGWLLPNGTFVPLGKEREVIERVEEVAPPKLKPPAANLWRWLFDTFQIGAVDVYDPERREYVKGFKSLDEVKRAFYALPAEEQKSLIEQYRSYLPSFKYPDMETFLKVKHDLTMDDLGKLSNEEKIKLWNEFWTET